MCGCVVCVVCVCVCEGCVGVGVDVFVSGVCVPGVGGCGFV